jgi:hypothetical protein
MTKTRKPATTSALLVLAATMTACTSTRTIVITNNADQSFEMRREGAKTAITVDPGGSTTLDVPAGQPVDLNGIVVQVY